MNNKQAMVDLAQQLSTPAAQAALAAADNEWMRRYTEEPEKFEREFQTVSKFLEETATGAEPSYGQKCAAYTVQLLTELAAEPAEAT